MTTRLLVVEDNPDMLATLALVLRAEGYEVATAQNGMEAQQLLASGAPLPAVILLDLQMPVMDGPTFLSTLPGLGLPDALRIPVLVLTASSARPANVAATLRKPFELDELLQTVRHLH